MENLTVTITPDKLQAGFQNAVDKIFESSYSNPMIDLLTKAIKDKEGAIKLIIEEIIAKSLSDPEFKKRMADAVISRMVEASFRK